MQDEQSNPIKTLNQVHLWTGLAPLFFILLLSVLLFKISSHWVFPLMVLIGIPVCLKWKLKGFSGLCIGFAVISFIAFENIEVIDRFWYLGALLAYVFSCIILILSSDEVEKMLNKILVESQSRLDNCLILDEELKKQTQDYELKKNRSSEDIQSLQHEIETLKAHRDSSLKVVQLTQQELVLLKEHYDSLYNDYAYKKQQLIHMQEQLEISEQTIQMVIDTDSEKEIRALKAALADNNSEREMFQAKFDLISDTLRQTKSEKEALIEENRALHASIELLNKNLVQLIDNDKVLTENLFETENALTAFKHECASQKESIESLKKQCEDHLTVQQDYEKQTENQLALLSGREKTLREHLLSLQNELNVSKDHSESQEQHILNLEEQQAKELQLMSALQREHQVLQERYHELGNTFKRTQEGYNSLKEQNDLLISSGQVLNEKWESICLSEEAIKQDYQEATQELTLIKNQRQIQEERLSLLATENQTFAHLVTDLQKKLDTVLDENASIKAQLEEKKLEIERHLATVTRLKAQKNQLPVVKGNNREIESMFLQLKQQFAEKSATLEETRKELFFLKEKMNQREMEWIELEDEYELRLQKQFMTVASTHDHTIKEYQLEVSELSELVDRLIASKK